LTERPPAPAAAARTVIPIAAAPQGEGLYAAHRKIYPRSVKGVFARWRWALVFATQLVF
jgi:hypothetical protein